MKRATSIFSLFCGLAMLVVWGRLLVTGQVLELQTRPFETMFLLAAEFLTAMSLILAGIGLLTRKSWGLSAELIALGMLLYCTVFYIGVLAQEGNVPAVTFFSVIVLLAATFSATFVLESAKGGTQ